MTVEIEIFDDYCRIMFIAKSSFDKLNGNFIAVRADCFDNIKRYCISVVRETNFRISGHDMVSFECSNEQARQIANKFLF